MTVRLPTREELIDVAERWCAAYGSGSGRAIPTPLQARTEDLLRKVIAVFYECSLLHHRPRELPPGVSASAYEVARASRYLLRSLDQINLMLWRDLDRLVTSEKYDGHHYGPRLADCLSERAAFRRDPALRMFEMIGAAIGAASLSDSLHRPKERQMPILTATGEDAPVVQKGFLSVPSQSRLRNSTEFLALRIIDWWNAKAASRGTMPYGIDGEWTDALEQHLDQKDPLRATVGDSDSLGHDLGLLLLRETAKYTEWRHLADAYADLPVKGAPGLTLGTWIGALGEREDVQAIDREAHRREFDECDDTAVRVDGITSKEQLRTLRELVGADLEWPSYMALDKGVSRARKRIVEAFQNYVRRMGIEVPSDDP